MEIRKDIEWYEWLYQISNKWRVKSFDFRWYKRIKIMKPYICSKKWYCRIILVKDKIWKAFLIHRLVAKAFIENPLNKLQVDHIDNVKYNNSYNNLQWVTNKENNELRYSRDGYVTTYKQRTAALNNKYKCKTVVKKDKSWTVLLKYNSLKECAIEEKINLTILSLHCNHKRNIQWDYIYSFLL